MINIKYGPRLGSRSVVQCTLLNKDIHLLDLWPNSIIMTTLKYKKIATFLQQNYNHQSLSVGEEHQKLLMTLTPGWLQSRWDHPVSRVLKLFDVEFLAKLERLNASKKNFCD